jgi:hypothetical protein
MGEEVIAGYCAISTQGKYTKARKISLGGKLEIMDAELAVIYEALKDRKIKTYRKKRYISL